MLEFCCSLFGFYRFQFNVFPFHNGEKFLFPDNGGSDDRFVASFDVV